MFIITSKKKDIKAISGTNNDVDFHNKLFDTDDCVITFQPDPTPEEIVAQKAQQILDEAEAKIKREAEEKEEALVQQKLRSWARAELVKEGKLE
jgi:hypothetical protein